jgi:hypothetical protein
MVKKVLRGPAMTDFLYALSALIVAWSVFRISKPFGRLLDSISRNLDRDKGELASLPSALIRLLEKRKD